MSRLFVLSLAVFCLSFVSEARADANADRLGLMPTANTLKEGEFLFNNYELFLVQGTYGITDKVQVSLGGLIPITSELNILQLSAKYRFFESPRLRAALALNSFMFFVKTSSTNMLGTITATPVLSICLDEGECESLVNVGLGITGAFGSGSIGFIDEGGILTPSAGIVYKVGGSVKLVAEFTTLGAFAQGQVEFARMTTLTYGVRFFGERIAGDLGFIRPLGPDIDFSILPLGFPAVNFSYRFGGS